MMTTDIYDTPAIVCPLSGRHLIEASAGTGKTWTLTGILLRVLVEKRTPPERIIATTFTRAAAREMQERLFERLQSFERVCKWAMQADILQDLLAKKGQARLEFLQECQKYLQKIPSSQPPDTTLDNSPNKNFHKHSNKHFDNNTNLNFNHNQDNGIHRHFDGELSDDLGDVVNIHLLGVLIDENRLENSLHWLSVIRLNLDKAFIGTLDSLAQKWLNEFGAQIGIANKLEVLPNPLVLARQILHDTLRNLHSYLSTHHTNLYRHLFLGESPLLPLTLFSDIDTALKNSQNVLNFLTAPITLPSEYLDIGFDNGDNADKCHYQINHHNEITTPLSVDELFDDKILITLNQRFEDLRKLDYSKFHQNLMDDLGVNKTRSFGKKWRYLIEILTQLKDESTTFLMLGQLNKNQKEYLLSLPNEMANISFNKGCEHNISLWQELPLGQLTELANLYVAYQNVATQFEQKLTYYVATALREGLDKKLSDNQQTTFGKQMADLANALAGEQGALLARHIRHLYPVALIDEVQDINGEQLALIERLYFGGRANDDIFAKNAKNQGFVLCVGDPKQAIYRFRGGDVQNYNNLKKQGLNSQFSLTVNRRSVGSLIEVLNAWFGRESSRQFGDEIYYQQVSAHNAHHTLSWQQALNELASVGADLGGAFPSSPVAVLHLALPAKDKKNKADDDKANQGADGQGNALSHNSSDAVSIKRTPSQDRYRLVAKHINTLLQNGKKIAKDGTISPLLPSDIAVLATQHHSLENVKNALAEYQIDAVSAKMGNVFAVLACQQLYELLLASVDDSDHRLGAVLGGLFCLDLASVRQILADDDKKLRLIAYLKTIQQKWLTLGVGGALEWAFFAWQFYDWHCESPKNLWQFLAQFEGGERYLTDVWQLFGLFCEADELADVIRLPSKFLPRLANLMQAGTDDETYPRIALPSESAVHLSTIHRSKGLEYAVVYVLGLSSDYADGKEGLYSYMSDGVRHLSPSDVHQPDNYQALVEERKRLGYVALTRASSQLFVVAEDKSYARKSVLSDWGFYDKEKFVNPLTHLVSVLDMYTLEASLVTTPYCADNAKKTPIHQPDWEQIFAKKRFVGYARTSFTGLSHLFDKTKEHYADVQTKVLADESLTHPDVPDYAVLENEVLPDVMLNPDEHYDIRQSFLRGAQAGTFLHKVFEEMVFFDDDNLQKNALSKLIDDNVKKHKLPNEYLSLMPTNENYQETIKQHNRHNALLAWLNDVANSPLASGICLSQIAKTNKKSELGFIMGIDKTLDVKKINAIFKEYCPEIEMPELIDDGRLFNFLSGEIDLVYRHQGKYYVVDYKSNYLADNWQEYHQQAMTQAMNKSGYWLQAVIYQVALHRLLSLRILDYAGNESQYLGAVEYVFVRGIMPNANGFIDNERTGHLIWHIPLGLVLALDKIF